VIGGSFAPRKTYDIPLATGGTLHLGERTLVMGILNVTPDSFSDGGRLTDPAAALDAAQAMEASGADLIDVGGESTRPGAEPASEHDELARVVPVLDVLAGRLHVPISIDTYKATVAREALDRGAAIVNDVSGLRYDPGLGSIVAERGAGLILMHNRGRSREMYRLASYTRVVDEVAAELSACLEEAARSGVGSDAIVIDPGLGFSKKAEHSLEVLASLPRLAAAIDRPLLVGASRKSFLQAAVGERRADAREWASAAAVAACAMLGAHIVRVHAVGAMVDVVRVIDRLREERTPAP
jgi:dihydropteroate synthase